MMKGKAFHGIDFEGGRRGELVWGGEEGAAHAPFRRGLETFFFLLR
jgi:hypothetical protein